VGEHAGKVASRAERTERGLLGEGSLVYGEAAFPSFVAVLRQYVPRLPTGGAGHFVDLGSGCGKAVVAAALAFDFASCTGIELLESLHAMAEEASARLVRVLAEASGAVLARDLPAVTFVHGSFLDYDWSRADVVFMNSTCEWGLRWAHVQSRRGWGATALASLAMVSHLQRLAHPLVPCAATPAAQASTTR
jgi:hypothetical protein